MQIAIYHITDHLNIMNRVVHLIQNTCIKVIVTWSLILMDTFSSLNIYWRMHLAWLACFLFKQEALLVFKVHLDFTKLFSIVISNHPLHVIFFDIYMTSHMPIVYLHGEHMFLFLFTVLGCSFTSLEITHIKTNI